MAITTQAGLLTALKGGQQIRLLRTGNRNTVTAGWGALNDLTAPAPLNGVLAGTSTAAGVVPTDATLGCPVINPFGAGNTGYIGSIQDANSIGTTVGGYRHRLCDMLFKAGAYAFNAAVTLASQPSYSSRIPGADYGGTEIWVETVTTFTGTPSIAVTYTNQAGTAGRTTGTVVGTAAYATGRVVQLPLQAGDTGVQKIESVTATVASVGTFNILVLRPLWAGVLDNQGIDLFHGPDKTDLPILFDDSAFYMMTAGQSGGAGSHTPDTIINVING